MSMHGVYMYTVQNSFNNLSFVSPVASCAVQCPQYGWHTGRCSGTLAPQTHSHPNWWSQECRRLLLGPERCKKMYLEETWYILCTHKAKMNSCTCSAQGWRSWRCVKLWYSSNLQCTWVEKVNSWHWRDPLLHWRKKTFGSCAPITMNSCSWGNFLSGRKGRRYRHGARGVKYHR